MQAVVVVFDVGGVLCDDIPSPMFEYLASLPAYSSDPTLREKIASLHRNTHEAWGHFKLDASYPESSYWTLLLSEGGVSHIIKESTDELAKLVREKSMNCFSHTLGVAKKLKESGYTVGILSNHSSPWFREMAAKFHFDEIFDEDLTVISCDHGCAKPDPRFYNVLIDKVKAKYQSHTQPPRIVFLDDKQANVAAARECGIDAFQFQSKKSSSQDLIRILNEKGVSL